MAEIELKALEEELFSEMLDDYTLSLMEPHERRQRLGMYPSLHLTYLGGVYTEIRNVIVLFSS